MTLVWFWLLSNRHLLCPQQPTGTIPPVSGHRKPHPGGVLEL